MHLRLRIFTRSLPYFSRHRSRGATRSLCIQLPSCGDPDPFGRRAGGRERDEREGAGGPRVYHSFTTATFASPGSRSLTSRTRFHYACNSGWPHQSTRFIPVSSSLTNFHFLPLLLPATGGHATHPTRITAGRLDKRVLFPQVVITPCGILIWIPQLPRGVCIRSQENPNFDGNRQHGIWLLLWSPVKRRGPSVREQVTVSF